jgi:hypothetical protein
VKYVAKGPKKPRFRDGPFLGLFEAVVAAGASPRCRQLDHRRDHRTSTDRRRRATLALDGGTRQLVQMVDRNELSSTAVKDVLIAVLAGEGIAVAEKHDLLQVTDEGAIAARRRCSPSTPTVARIAAGEEKHRVLVGKVMRAGGGKADPKAVDRLVRAQTLR